MKIGFLFGSFDPIHIGHLHMISAVLSEKVVDKVIVVPTFQNPWKKTEPLPFQNRCEMIEKSIEPFGNSVELSRIEETVVGTTYSYKTCQLLRKKYSDDDLYIIAGNDVAKQIKNWKNYETEIKSYFGVIEILREDSSIISAKYYPNYIFIKAPLIEVSSTMVKEFIKNGKNPYPYLTPNLIQIIEENYYYK